MLNFSVLMSNSTSRTLTWNPDPSILSEQVNHRGKERLSHKKVKNYIDHVQIHCKEKSIWSEKTHTSCLISWRFNTMLYQSISTQVCAFKLFILEHLFDESHHVFSFMAGVCWMGVWATISWSSLCVRELKGLSKAW